MQNPIYAEGGMTAAASWLQHLLLGSLATPIAVLAVAATGAMMLTGRVDLRRGAAVILGCFLLFGAPVIAAGLYTMLNGAAGGTSAKAPPPAPTPPSAPASSNPFDPYAGAAVPQHR
jgi:type IV secretory pathway VirB2 component (pilin)